MCVCVVVGSGFVLTSSAFMGSSASHPAGQQGWLAIKVNRAPLLGAGSFDTTVAAVTAPPLVSCVNWILVDQSSMSLPL